MNAMNVVAQIVPIAFVVLVIALIVRSRFGRMSLGDSFRRNAARIRPVKKKPGVVLPFDRSKMDDELNALLRKRR
jgi:hypothetical protein